MKKSLQIILIVAVMLGSALAYFISPVSVGTAGAQFAASPVFTQNGQQTNLLTCGTPITFNVPGQTQVWLTQFKSSLSTGNNQQTTYDGPYTVPSTYTPDCTRDLGTFQNSVYTLVNGQKGNFLGTVEATVKSNAPATSGEVTISDTALRTCFDHLAATGGVLQSSDPTLSPGEWLIHTMNTQPAFKGNPITSANVSRSTLDQIVSALNTTPFGGPHYYFDSNACVGLRSDGVAYSPQGYVLNWSGGSLNTNGCPAWWTGNDRCSYSAGAGSGGSNGVTVGNGTLGANVPAANSPTASVDQSQQTQASDINNQIQLQLLSIQSQLNDLTSLPTGADPNELLSKVQDIQKQLNDVMQSQFTASGGSVPPKTGASAPPISSPAPASSSSCHVFSANLGEGDTGTEIAALQAKLQLEGFIIQQAELTGSIFGSGTKEAVSNFQLKYKSDILDKIDSLVPTGYFGPLSRAKMNALYPCANTGGNGTGGGNGTVSLTCSFAGQDVFAPAEQYVPVFNPAADKTTDSKFGVIYPPAAPYTHPPLADFSPAFLDDFTNRVYGVPFAKLKRITDPAIKAKFDAAAHVFAHGSLHVPEDQGAAEYDEFNKEFAQGLDGSTIASSLNRRALVFQKAGLSVGEVLLNYIDLETRSPGRSTYGLDAEPNEATLRAYFHLLNELYKKNIPQYQFFFDWNKSIGFSNTGAAWTPQGYVFDWRRNGWTADGFPTWWSAGSANCSL